jgi:hypothetical protein
VKSVYSAVGLSPYIKQVFITEVVNVYSVVRPDSLYKAGFITEVESVYSAVRTKPLYKAGFFNLSGVFTTRYGLSPYIKQVFITEVVNVYSAVRTESLYYTYVSSLKAETRDLLFTSFSKNRNLHEVFISCI